ncbi:transcriptional regulator BetI [Fulvimarina sp. 2208YS6-2-32]|uniref:HTH-type transcriptional regulator BetI n=1 Tax=Fulvimarina uroteuthidis TaxID=3098149 RepID=A0ABU5HXD4_9HYPH|nr:transcriptional regulator BetI [Fulvimarina sp. 2208YS6-2-32]MDY8107705.1 transcriptional regulator BetI [Fulvimarina sp. 2208YS6-2-32]
MPKIGMELVRREALISAAIAEIGAAGSVDVTVSRIARRAGVSSALAHHYFGSKEQIIIAAMRHILDAFGQSVKQRYAEAGTPRARIEAVIASCFEPEQFDKAIVSAWLAFYVEANRSRDAARLLRVYARRLDSNLVHALRSLMPIALARQTSQGLASMIDGLYIRAALQERAPRPKDAAALVVDYLDKALAKGNCT